jgi:hypothetical protein
MALTIVTNNHQRDLLAGYEIPAAVWNSEFDYLGKYEESNENAMTPRFFKYQDSWYDEGDMMPTNDHNGAFAHGHRGLAEAGYDGWISDTHFSGIAIRYGTDWAGQTDYSTVIVARFAELD